MVDYDPFSERMRTDPFPVYAQLRAESPVHYVERLDAWALALFEDVWNAGQDNEHFDQPGPSFQNVGDDAPPIFQAEDPGRRTIFTMNPPNHTALRKALTKHFSPGAIRRLEDDVRAPARWMVRCSSVRPPTGPCCRRSSLATSRASPASRAWRPTRSRPPSSCTST